MSDVDVAMSGVAGGRRVQAEPLGIVDCDVHSSINSVRDLYPYLARRWREHIERFGIHTYAGGYYPRFMDRRADAVPPSGMRPGADPAFAGTHHLDRYGIAYAVLNPLTEVGQLQNLDLDAALASAVNDWTARRWLDADPRFRGSIVIPFHDPVASVREMRRWAGDRRFVQVQLTGRPREPMGRRAYWPIYEACAELDLAVMSHAFGSAGEPTTGAGWPSYYLEEHVGPAQAIQANIVSMAAEGVFERFPTLRLVSLENGFGWIVAMLWRMRTAWARYRSEMPHLRRPADEYVLEHVYLATQPMEEPPRRALLTQLFEHCPELGGRLVFASDYPHWDGDAPDRAVPHSLGRELRARIMAGNARELYGLR